MRISAIKLHEICPRQIVLWALLRPKCVGRDSAPDPATGSYSSGPSPKPPLPFDLVDAVF